MGQRCRGRVDRNRRQNVDRGPSADFPDSLCRGCPWLDRRGEVFSTQTRTRCPDQFRLGRSDMPIPLSVAYSATKHAIKGFTDGLRNESMQEELPISVTLIKPSAIDTQFFDHAKTEMGGMGKSTGSSLCAGSRGSRDNTRFPASETRFPPRCDRRFRGSGGTDGAGICRPAAIVDEAFRSRRFRPYARCGFPA